MRFGLQLRSLLLLLALVCACPAFGQTPTITSQSAPRRAVLAGQPLTLTVEATGASPLAYQWRRNGRPIDGATAAAYRVESTTARNNGWYQVVVSSATRSTLSAPIHVNVATPQAQVFELGNYYPAANATLVPQPAGRLTAVSRIAAGNGHNLAVTHEGTVVAWGVESAGQTQVPDNLTEVVDVTAGYDYSVALRANGRVVAWGNNTRGQTSVPATLDQVVKLAAGNQHTLALRADGTVVAWGSNAAYECDVPRTLVDVVAIGAGAAHSVALKADGTVVVWGANSYNQRAIPAGLSGVVDIAVATNHTFALRADGSVVAWGGNERGALNLPAGLGSVTMLASGGSILALKSDGTLVGWGPLPFNSVPLPGGLTQVAAICAGGGHALVLRTDTTERAPVISVHPRSQTVSYLREFSISVTASGHPLNYQWRRNGVPIPQATQATFKSTGGPSTYANLDVEVSNSKGSVISHAAIISEPPGPWIFSPEPVRAVIGRPAVLEVQAWGMSYVTYQWYRNGQAIPGATSARYHIASVTEADAAIYHVAAIDVEGTTLSRDFPLTIVRLPVFTIPPTNVEASPGDDVEFTATVAEPSETTFDWSKDGVVVLRDDQQSPTRLALSKVTLADAGTYQVTARTLAGTISSQPVTLSFPTTPSVKPARYDIVANEGAGLILGCEVASATPITRYHWRFNGVLIDHADAVRPTLTINPLTEAHSGVYDVVATNAAGSGIGRRTVLTVRPRPAIVTQPAAAAAQLGQQATFNVTARYGETYLWRKDGVPLLGNPTATTPNLRLSALTAAEAGSYDVIVENQVGHVISQTAPLLIQDPSGRLSNVSILAELAAGGEALTVGLVTGGANTAADKALLIRAVGPSLSQLGVQGALPDPKLDVLSGATVIGSNDDWRTSQLTALIGAFLRVGAFSYSGPGALDAALYLPSVARGDYTARITSTTPAGGWVLAEVYDATPAAEFGVTTPRLINLSVIKRITSSLTAGFVITGTQPKAVLIRAIGPSLAEFGVVGFMPDPKLELFDSQRASLTTNDNWGGTAELSGAFSRSGAFAVESGSRDAALLRSLAPGPYTVQVTAADGTAGISLIEIYEVP